MKKKNCDYKKNGNHTLNLFIILGSKESFEEPKDLTQKVRDALRRENPKKTSNTDSANSTESSADESVKKRDKV